MLHPPVPEPPPPVLVVVVVVVLIPTVSPFTTTTVVLLITVVFVDDGSCIFSFLQEEAVAKVSTVTKIVKIAFMIVVLFLIVNPISKDLSRKCALLDAEFTIKPTNLFKELYPYIISQCIPSCQALFYLLYSRV